MARGMHRHRSIRRERLAEHKLETRARKAPAKVALRARRDIRAVAAVKATAAGTAHAPWVQSWLSATVGKPYGKLSAADIAAAVA
jgi:hypothetical protein